MARAPNRLIPVPGLNLVVEEHIIEDDDEDISRLITAHLALSIREMPTLAYFNIIERRWMAEGCRSCSYTRVFKMNRAQKRAYESPGHQPSRHCGEPVHCVTSDSEHSAERWRDNHLRSTLLTR